MGEVQTTPQKHRFRGVANDHLPVDFIPLHHYQYIADIVKTQSTAESGGLYMLCRNGMGWKENFSKFEKIRVSAW